MSSLAPTPDFLSHCRRLWLAYLGAPRGMKARAWRRYMDYVAGVMKNG